MVLKILRGLWFLSALGALAVLLYVYAGLPNPVMFQDGSTGPVSVSREAFFYMLILFLLIVNVLVYAISKMFPTEEAFRAWFHGLIMTLNIFLISAMLILSIYNSSEKFDYGKIGFLAYASLLLVILWAVAWPFYSLFRKYYSKVKN